MEKQLVRKCVDAIKSTGIERYTIICNDAYLIEVNSESTKCIFDDNNSCIWFFRIPNNVSPKDPHPIALHCAQYELIERIIVPSDLLTIKTYVNNLGLELTDEITTWLKKAASQFGINPVNSKGDPNKSYYKDLPTGPNIPMIK